MLSTDTEVRTSVTVETTPIATLAFIGLGAITAIGISLGSSLTFAAFSIASSGPTCNIEDPNANCDSDTILNGQDNCILVANEDQFDSNGDGYGNWCDADYNNDGVVGIPDRNIFRASWGTRIGEENYNLDTDCQNDGVIGTTDFSCFRAGFNLGVPGPSGLAAKLLMTHLTSVEKAVAGGTENTVGEVTVSAVKDDIEIMNVRLRTLDAFEGISGGHDEVENVSLYRVIGTEEMLLGSSNIISNRIVDIPVNTVVTRDSDALLRFKVKSNEISDASPAEAGAGFMVRLQRVDAKRLSNDFSPEIHWLSGRPIILGKQWVFKSLPTVRQEVFEGTNKITGNGTVDLYHFSIEAQPQGPVGFYKAVFEVEPFRVTLDPSGYTLYESNTPLGKNLIVATGGDLVVNGNTVEAYLDVDNNHPYAPAYEQRIISQGVKKYYTLEGTITSGHDTIEANEAIVTMMLNDNAFPGNVQMNAAEVDTTADDNFIWSDLHLPLYATTTATNSAMFYNGYNVIDDSDLGEQIVYDGSLACSDTDGGDNIYEKGIVIGPTLTTGARPEDYCAPTPQGPSDSLIEYACLGEVHISQGTKCIAGCGDGACPTIPAIEILSSFQQGNTVQEGGDDQIMGVMQFEAQGEQIAVNEIGWTFEVESETANVSDITNVSIYNEAGQIVAGPVDPSVTSENDGTATTTDPFIVDFGKEDYTIKADLSTDFSSGDTITLVVYTFAIDAVGQSSGSPAFISQYDPPGTTPPGVSKNPPVSVEGAHLSVGVSNSPTGQTVAAGTQDFNSANIILDATESADDILITGISLSHKHTGDSFPFMLTNWRLFANGDAVPIQSESVTCGGSSCNTPGTRATTTFTIATGELYIPANTTTTLQVVHDVGTGATSGTFRVGCNGCVTNAIDGNAYAVPVAHTNGDGQEMILTGGVIVSQRSEGINTDDLEIISSNGMDDAIVRLKNGRWFGDTQNNSGDARLSYHGNCSELDYAEFELSDTPGGPYTGFASLGGPNLCEVIADVHGAGPEPYLRIRMQGGTFEDIAVIFDNLYEGFEIEDSSAIVSRKGGGLNTDMVNIINTNDSTEAVVELKNNRLFGDTERFSNDTFFSYQGDCSNLDYAELELSVTPDGTYTGFASLGGPNLCEVIADVHGAGPEPYLRIRMQGGTFEDIAVIFNFTTTK